MGAMQCATCSSPLTSTGKTFRCTCGGTWVPEAAFVEMVAVMREGRVIIPWQERAGDERPCPQCHARMTPCALRGVALDRCDPHGIWFDDAELQRVLELASKFEIDEGPQQSVFADPSLRKAVFGDSSSFNDREREGFLGALLRLLLK